VGKHVQTHSAVRVCRQWDNLLESLSPACGNLGRGRRVRQVRGRSLTDLMETVQEEIDFMQEQ